MVPDAIVAVFVFVFSDFYLFCVWIIFPLRIGMANLYSQYEVGVIVLLAVVFLVVADDFEGAVVITPGQSSHEEQRKLRIHLHILFLDLHEPAK